jgi:hypothetical protein
MRKLLRLFPTLLLIASANLVAVPVAVHAATPCENNGGVSVSTAFNNDKTVGNECIGSKDQNPIFALIRIISQFMIGLFGLILVGVVVYSGFRYVISGGSPDDIKDAKNKLKGAVTGILLLVVMAALLNSILPGGVL